MEVSTVVARGYRILCTLGRSHSRMTSCHPNEIVSFYLCNRSCTTRIIMTRLRYGTATDNNNHQSFTTVQGGTVNSTRVYGRYRSIR